MFASFTQHLFVWILVQEKGEYIVVFIEKQKQRMTNTNKKTKTNNSIGMIYVIHMYDERQLLTLFFAMYHLVCFFAPAPPPPTPDRPARHKTHAHQRHSSSGSEYFRNLNKLSEVLP